MRVIYIDILLFLNFYITYFLIVGTCCLLHSRITLLRRILGASFGAASSLIILLPQMSILLGAIVKLLFSTAIMFISLGFGNLRLFIGRTLLFFLVNCIYAGIMMGLWLFSAPVGMVYNNGAAYFDIPVWMALLSTAAAYFILRIIRYFADSKTSADKKYTLEIVTEKGKAALTALPDSGNKLTDFFSGLPVIFCDINKCASVCPDAVIMQLSSEAPESREKSIKGIRLIPCTTVSGGVTAICFKPQKIFICDGSVRKEVSALIGFTKNGINGKDFEAIFNPRIL